MRTNSLTLNRATILLLVSLLSLAAQTATGAMATVTVQVDDHSGTGISDVQVRYGPVGNPTQSYFGSQPTDGSGQATGDLTVGQTYQFRVDYHHGYAVSASLTVDSDSNNNLVQFQTNLLTLRLEDCNGTPLDGGSVRYGAGASYGTSFWPSGDTGSSNPGETEAEFFPGTYSFEMKINNTTEVKSSVVIPDADTTLTWQTTTVTLAYNGQISYGGGSGDSAFFKSSSSPGSESKELLPGTNKFHFRGGGPTLDISYSGCSYNAALVTLNLKDHNGNPLAGGTARGGYSSTSFGWHVSGSTDSSGNLYELRSGNTNLAYEMKYNGTTAVIGPKDAMSDPLYEFQTNQLTLRLEDCNNTPLDGADASFGSGAIYSTRWFPNDTDHKHTGDDAPGEMNGEIFPGTYSFKMQYKASADLKISVVIPDADTTLTWQTTTVILHHQYTIAYGGPTGDSKFYTNPMELLPGTIWFNFRTPPSEAGYVRRQLSISGCEYEKTVAIARVEFTDGTGRPDFSGVWRVDDDPNQSWPESTDADGNAVILIDGDPTEDTTVCVQYDDKEDCLTQDAATNSVYVFVPQNTLTVSSTLCGSVTEPGEGAFDFDYDTVVDINAVADIGVDPNSVFLQWEGTAVDAGKVADPFSAISTVLVDSDYTLIAHFLCTPDVSTYPIHELDATNLSVNLRGGIVHDGGEACQIAFIYWPMGGESMMTDWSQTTYESSDVFTQFLDNLMPDMTYYYRALARNSVGQATGDVRSFVTQALLTISSSNGGSVVDPGEGVFGYDSGTSVPVEAVPTGSFVFDKWTGTAVEAGLVDDPNAASTNVTVIGDYTLKAQFVSILTEIHVNDDAPSDPGPNDLSVSDPEEDGSSSHPFDSIQEAITLAMEGSVIVVHGGTYMESLDFMGKAVTVTSADPALPCEYAYPVIDANEQGTVVVFNSGEDANSILDGFILTGGLGDQAGAVLCDNTSPTISHCVMIGNRATNANGGAVLCSNSSCVMTQCTIADNFGGETGAGVHCLLASTPSLINSIVWENLPEDIRVRDTSVLTVAYSDSGVAQPGTGNVVEDPSFAVSGHWGDINNLVAEVAPNDPNAVWVDGDYHLQSVEGRWDPIGGTWTMDLIQSAVIDAGDPNSAVECEPAPNGDRVNMGAYGGSNQASKTPEE